MPPGTHRGLGLLKLSRSSINYKPNINYYKRSIFGIRQCVFINLINLKIVTNNKRFWCHILLYIFQNYLKSRKIISTTQFEQTVLKAHDNVCIYPKTLPTFTPSHNIITFTRTHSPISKSLQNKYQYTMPLCYYDNPLSDEMVCYILYNVNSSSKLITSI